ncbi:MAG: GTPase ObgE [bacterium]
MFMDKVKINIISGSGGNGIVAWRKEKHVPKGGPAGGDGGHGGSIVIIAERNMTTLIDYKYKSLFVAKNGEQGGQKNMHGANAKDLVLKVPCGTIIRDVATGKIIGDLVNDGQSMVVATGGRGGRGNSRFTSSTRRAPQFCEPGESGIERELELELKLIADVGLLGMPNAGKSTFISVISAAKPKIADYPFTTLIPNLGVVRKPSGDGYLVADIPGLIEGASEGLGLGHEFLRHVERTRILVHILDMTEEDPINNYNIINNELAKFGSRLSDIPQIVALNKIDAVYDEEKIETVKKYFVDNGQDVFVMSAATGNGTKELVYFITKKVEEIPLPDFNIQVEEDDIASNHDDSGFTIVEDYGTFTVVGGKVERLASVTDLENHTAVLRLQNILKAMGVMDALAQSGIQDGDTVKLGQFAFEYYKDDIGEEENER